MPTADINDFAGIPSPAETTLYSARHQGPWLGNWEIPQSCLGLTLGTSILAASLADWRSNAQRDILAWAGIGAFVANLVLPFAYQRLYSASR